MPHSLAHTPVLEGRTLLDELNHRIKNELASVINLVGWRLALAIYELVTNAARHACFDGRDGEIKIKLMRAGSWVNCRVSDNGSGLGRIKPGRGLQIVGELAKSLGGRIGHTFGTAWTSFALDFPLTQREQHANRAIAGRRPRTGRRLRAMPPLPPVPAVGEPANPVTLQPQL